MNSNKIPTVEEFLAERGLLNVGVYGLLASDTSKGYMHKQMIEFAQMHVKAALEAASEKATTSVDLSSSNAADIINKNSILNAYPLTNIK